MLSVQMRDEQSYHRFQTTQVIFLTQKSKITLFRILVLSLHYFKAPQPPDSWEGVRDATVEGNPCYSRHIGLNIIVGDENCLFLNVYTPEVTKLYS